MIYNPISRREALRRVIAVSIALSADQFSAFGKAPAQVRGIGTDPDLLKKEIPWSPVLTASEMKTVTLLGDIILPADEHGPSASAVGVPDFLNEWVSAPYEEQQADLAIIRDGLVWLDAEARRRFTKEFADLSSEQQEAIVEDIVSPETAAHQQAIKFFRVFRDRAYGGYYSTPEGWKAIGYVGNVPLTTFPAPTPEVLRHLGLDPND